MIIEEARRDFDVGIAGGYAKDSGNMFIGAYAIWNNNRSISKFRSYRPEVNFLNLHRLVF
jgi:hypothetical protein